MWPRVAFIFIDYVAGFNFFVNARFCESFINYVGSESGTGLFPMSSQFIFWQGFLFYYYFSRILSRWYIFKDLSCFGMCACYIDWNRDFKVEDFLDKVSYHSELYRYWYIIFWNQKFHKEIWGLSIWSYPKYFRFCLEIWRTLGFYFFDIAEVETLYLAIKQKK